MSEAFTIGVSLALCGGVAGETAKARNERIRFRAALIADGVTIQQLRETARATVDKFRTAPEGSVQPSSQEKDLAGELSYGEELRPPQSTARDIAKPDVNVERQPTMTTAENAGPEPKMQPRTSIREEPQRRVLPRVVLAPKMGNAPVGKAERPAISDFTVTPTPVMSQARLGAGPASKQSQDSASTVMPRAGLSTTQQSLAASSVSAFAYETATLPASRSMTSYAAAQPRRAFPETEPYRATAINISGPSSFPSAPRRAPQGGSHALETASQNSMQSNPQDGLPRNDSSMSDILGQPRDNGQSGETGGGGRIQGDVFLDGALVGRWMSRMLNREAERAIVGPTSFDTRRGRLMPGATVG